MNKKRALLITVLFSIFLTLITGTMSYLIWQTSESKRTFISFTVPNMCSVSVDGGGSINAGSVNMYPAVCTDTNATIVKEITLDVEFESGVTDVLVELWLNAKDIDSALSNSDNFRYTVSRSSSNCYDSVISTGSFKGVQSGGSVKIFEETYMGTYPEIKTDKLYLYIWLDEAETNVATAGANFSLSLGGNCSSVAISTGTVVKPVLDDGMIPVTIANNGTVTTVSEDDSSWYNYNEKKWANVVLVDSDSRSTYKNSTGVTVNQDDVLAYYTWIPRYKYKIWDVTGTSSPQSIEIEFESSTSIPVLGTAVDEWRTHPAFIWDDNPIPGIWVGKFETTGSESTPTILPNNLILVAQNVSTQFTTALKFAGGTFNTSTGEVSFSGNNTYGLTKKSDSHMMKNSEWGAVAYLSHSQYGINSEIRANDYIDLSENQSDVILNGKYITSCGTLDEGGTSECVMAFGTVDSYPQTTTGNINGIFDMSGGSYDIMMTDYNDNLGVSGFSVLPMSKYYDKYTTVDPLTACDGGICFGHAFSETKEWYDDEFIATSSAVNGMNSDSPWIGRGALPGYYESAGIWAIEAFDGGETYNTGWEVFNGVSWRSVIVPLVSTGLVDATISSTNNMSNSQSVTLSWDENSEVVSYSWGKTHPYVNSDWNDTTVSSVTETVNEPGTYYLGLKSSSGNITVVKKNFYETKFSVSNGTVSTNSYITMEGNSITLPEVTVNGGYVFFGWYTRDNGAGNKLENTYTPTYSSTIYANIKSNVLTITYYTDGGVLTDSTSDGTNTYNWSQEVNGLIKLNDVVYEDVYAYGQEVKLTKFNDSNYMNITKENYDAVSKSEWTCFDGCDELDKVFNQIDTYTTDDFCDVSDGPCTIKLKVNWVYIGN